MLKDKRAINFTCKIIYLLICICHQILVPGTLFSGRIFSPLLDRHFNNFKKGSDHIVAIYSLYTVILGETDFVRLFKKIKIFM